MTFLKSLLLAIIASVILTYVFGVSLLEMLNISIYMDHHEVEPLKALSISAIIVVALIVVSFAIVLTVFGTLIFTVLLLGGGVLMVGVGFFWPILIIALIIWLCFRDKPKVTSN